MSPIHKRNLGAAALLFILLIGGWLTLDGLTGHTRYVTFTDARLTVSEKDLENSPLRLSGDVLFYPGVFIDPEAPSDKRPQPIPAEIPGTLASISGNSEGFGTLAFTVSIPHGGSQLRMGLRSQCLSSAAALYINGKYAGSQGTPGTSADTERALYYPVDSFFEYRPGGTEVIVHLSNFHDLDPIVKGIFVGTADQIRLLTMKALARDLFIIGGLLVMGVKYFHFYYCRPSEREYLFFSLLCITIALRSFLVGQRYLLQLYPDIPWEFFSRTVLILFYLAGWAYFSFIQALYPRQFSKIVYRAVTVITGITVLFTLIASNGLTGLFILPFEMLLIAMLAYCLALSIRSYKENKEISRAIIGSFLVVSFCVANDILNSYSIIDTDSFSAMGVFLLVLMNSSVLSSRYAMAATRSENLLSELKRVNETLEQRVESRTQELDQANNRLILTNQILSEANQRLEVLTSADPLTGIPNRRALTRHLGDLLNTRFSRNGFINFCMLDLDHFKLYNDSYGHVHGDQCLILIAELLQRSVSDCGGIAARLGGEEFALVFISDDAQSADFRLKAILDGIRGLSIPHNTSPTAPIVTISAGCISFPLPCSATVLEMIESADKLMYQAKHCGRNQYMIAGAVHLG